MVIVHSYVKLPEGTLRYWCWYIYPKFKSRCHVWWAAKVLLFTFQPNGEMSGQTVGTQPVRFHAMSILTLGPLPKPTVYMDIYIYIDIEGIYPYTQFKVKTSELSRNSPGRQSPTLWMLRAKCHLCFTNAARQTVMFLAFAGAPSLHQHSDEVSAFPCGRHQAQKPAVTAKMIPNSQLQSKFG